MLGMLQFVFDEFHQFLVERGRKEKGLPLLGKCSDDFPDGREETHIQHPVRFVQNQRFHSFESGCSLLNHIQHPARATDDDLRAILQRLALGLESHSTIHNRGSDAHMLGEFPYDLENLFCQFPRRRDDQGLGLPRFGMGS